MISIPVGYSTVQNTFSSRRVPAAIRGQLNFTACSACFAPCSDVMLHHLGNFLFVTVLEQIILIPLSYLFLQITIIVFILEIEMNWRHQLTEIMACWT
jgi:hypothetical protein